MGDLSRNVSRYELACKCGCGADTVDAELVQRIQESVNHFQRLYPNYKIRVRITSGARCKKHNRAEGGSEKSQHLVFKAADYYLYYNLNGKEVRISADDVASYLENRFPTTYGIGRYDGRTHLDIRKTKARWDNRR